MKKSKISIIIPVFNASLYIRDTLLSCINQSFKNFEIILINDGSTDNSEAIINEIIALNPQKSIRLINQVNQGASTARNNGLNYATGDFIQFFDADDLMHPDKLAYSVSLIAKHNCDAVITDFGRFKGVKTIPELEIIDYSSQLRKLHSDFKNIPIKELVVKYGFGCPRCFYRSEILENVSFSTNLKVNEDHLFNCEVLCNGAQFYYSPKVLMYYRNHESSTRLTKSPDRIEHCLNAIKEQSRLFLKSRIMNNTKWADHLIIKYWYYMIFTYGKNIQLYKEFKREVKKLYPLVRSIKFKFFIVVIKVVGFNIISSCFRFLKIKY